MMKNRWMWVSLVLVGALALSMTTSPPVQQADAQLIDIDVAGARRVIGHEPRCIADATYRVRQRWVPLSLAVYLDGQRCQRNVDYTVSHRDRTITFECKVNDDSVVIVDYEPR